MGAFVRPVQTAVRDGYVPVEGAALYFREVGAGAPVVVLHGGPDFDMNYFLPDLDRLSDMCRLIYYDQRGRGRSGEGVRPDDVSIESEIEDLERVREHFGLESMALLGHSWGGLLALEYAIRHPERLTHLILMNSAPVCHDDVAAFKQSRWQTFPGGMEQMAALASTDAYQQGDPATVAVYYRVHFSQTLTNPEHLQCILERLNVNATGDSILRSRAIEQRLYEYSWTQSDCSLLPHLTHLQIPTLLIHGDADFIPLAHVQRIEQALPDARLVVLDGCGHFSFLERPDEVHGEVAAFVRR